MTKQTALQTSDKFSCFFSSESAAKLVLKRYCVDRLPIKIIAQRLGIAGSSVSTFLIRQRKRVKQHLEQGRPMEAIAVELSLPLDAVDVLLLGQKATNTK
jgi:hypothetical protein